MVSSEPRLPFTLEEYGLSPHSGFLPQEWPVTELNDYYYHPWEIIVAKLPALITGGTLRYEVDKLPILAVSEEILGNIPQLRRCYSLLCFIANAYVWGSEIPCEILPDSIAQPLLIVSEELGLPPLSTYASLILWNFKESVDEYKISNLIDPIHVSIINTFTGLVDESWFYIISIFYEKIGGSCLLSGMNILEAIQDNNKDRVTVELQKVSENIIILGDLFKRMDEKTDPDVFYNTLRPFLAGWENMSDSGLSNGVKYGRNGEYKKFAGGSNAQSSLIQFLDILLNVKHNPTGSKNEKPETDSSSKFRPKSYIYEMRNYMPKIHREFLENFSNICNVKEFVFSNKENLSLYQSYEKCLDELKMFRDKHMQLVTRYIIKPAKKRAIEGSENKNTKEASGLAITGTGSTSFVLFLKQCRDDTAKTLTSGLQ